ncbi:MAG: 50S ribosomal protein L4, partial [Coriobacteriia bacterium]|nr:50S ribosomal protein L4 [Coriobacteriia bacterium]
IRAPQWAGGGVVFGPTPRNHSFRIPNKVVKLAMRSALSAKHAEKNLIVVDDMAFDAPSTKEAIKVLDALGLKDTKITVVLGNEETNAYLSLRNIPRVHPIFAFESNTYDLVNNTTLLLTKEAATYLGEVLS